MQAAHHILKKIKVKNFKSFRESELIFNEFNVIIGSNASGKSNFIQIFTFLKHIKEHGLENAISLQGGVENLTNITIGTSKALSIEISFDVNSRYAGRDIIRHRKPFEGSVKTIDYKFSIKFESSKKYKIIEDCITFHIDITDKKVPDKKCQGTITVSKIKEKLKTDLDFPKKIEIKNNDIIPDFIRNEKPKASELLFESSLLVTPSFIYPSWGEFINDLKIYDFDPKLSKNIVSIAGKSELESDGSNVSIVLRDVINAKDTKRKYMNLIKELLPFMDTIKIQKFSDKSLFFKVKEKYFDNYYLPSFLLSDGTISIISLVLALYFEDNRLAIIKEPERNIHPKLLVKLIEMMKETCRQKQIIITTHSPEIVSCAGIENIITISRDREGFSQIEKPINNERIKKFLENEISVSDMYVDNVLT